MKTWFILLSLFLPLVALSKEPLKIAVVDSGLNLQDIRFISHICPTGHKDFTGEGLTDFHGHGTAIAGLIVTNAGYGDYCLLIYKFYSSKNSDLKNSDNEDKAFAEAIKNGAKIVNFSGGGYGPDKKEYLTIKNNPNVMFIVSAGNDGKNIDLPENSYYPAKYHLPNERVVGSINKDHIRTNFSNWGKSVTDWELGSDILSMAPCLSIIGKNCTTRMSGTSMSTAIVTGKTIRRLLDDAPNRK